MIEQRTIEHYAGGMILLMSSMYAEHMATCQKCRSGHQCKYGAQVCADRDGIQQQYNDALRHERTRD